MDGETARALGFHFDDDRIQIKYFITPKIEDVVRLFGITTFHGTTDIITQEVWKVNGRKKMRSYLISTNGVLKAAALTVKVNGRFVAETIPVSEAQAGYSDELKYWIQYYRDNLKPN